MRPITFTPEDDARLLSLRRQGLTYKQIAHKKQRAEGTIKNRIPALLAAQEREQRRTERRLEYRGVGIDAEDLRWMRYWKQHARQRQRRVEQSNTPI